MIQQTQLLSSPRYINRGKNTLSVRLSLRSKPGPCSSQLYHTFDSVLLLSHGHTIYCGPGSFAPKDYFAHCPVPVRPYQHGYNIADYLLEVASDPPVGLFQLKSTNSAGTVVSPSIQDGADTEKGEVVKTERSKKLSFGGLKMNGGRYATTFLTQFEVLSGREWKILRR
jgi:hypothetical protein